MKHLQHALAAAAGVPDVAEKMMQEKKQYIDGTNNLDYWTGKSDKSSRDHIFHYYESKLTAVCMGPCRSGSVCPLGNSPTGDSR